MRIYLALPLSPQTFDYRMELFTRIARNVCPEVTAAHIIERARSIAFSLETGAAARRGDAFSPRRA